MKLVLDRSPLTVVLAASERHSILTMHVNLVTSPVLLVLESVLLNAQVVTTQQEEFSTTLIRHVI